MISKPYIDIIIPVYNSEKYIQNTVNSVLNQTYKYWRLIIIDDASTDNTIKILEKLYKKYRNKKKITILKNQVNKGQAFSRNLGLKYSKSKLVSFLDSDDFWDKNKLKNQIKFMMTNNYDFTYTDYKIIKNNKIKTIKVPNYFNYKKFIHNSSINTCSIILKKKIIKNIYFKNLRFSEDYFFKCQILKKNVNAYKCPGSYAYYLIRDNSLQSNRLSVLNSLWIINKNLNKMNFVNNVISILAISFNSLKKYGFR
jgi:teichuronic acid biosynthesis glycosyltransferase TuaG